ncbi:MAG: T9SS type A sorting domain-containing protein [Candidatus Delongbacteria bacterium]|nr:T9SS type A sorting domain-containing protein [Candidatus Delongbacteria bacterium]MCG2761267.1 T9SS type A sorting domain-containing protein [Candidatus Delongbacteria bacterium]
MIRRIIIFVIILSLNTGFAELVNVNPDPNGEPWISGGFKAPDNFDRSKLDFIKIVPLKTKELPSRVDNSLHKYFRPIFNQVGGSCSQAAGVGYTFTYEIDRLRDLPANVMGNQYPTHFTYDFLNEGSGEIGSWWGDGWDIIKSVGCMNVYDYGGLFAAGGNTRWISGINEWANGHYNRVGSNNAIDVGTPEGLNTLKNWIHNHLEGSPYGGLSVFAAGATGYIQKTLPAGTHEAGKKVITKWGLEVNHAMTYIGYDDSVRFDYNNDGIFTNDIDINGDRIVDMRDWEIGALIVANSWGESFGDSGKIYQMYKLLAEPYENGGIFYSFCDVVHPDIEIEPRYALEVKMKHTQRNTYRISVGCSENLYSDLPDVSDGFPFMRYQGGAYYPQGGRDESDKYIDFTLDITETVNKINFNEPFRFFFMIDETDSGNRYPGEIISITVVNKLTGRRYYNTAGSILMVNNGKTTVSVIVDEGTFVPENLIAYGGDGIAKLEWSGSISKTTVFDSYRIYKDGQLYLSDLKRNSFIDENVVNGNLYTYKISAVFNGTFNGEIFSFPAQVMPNEPSTLPYFNDFENGIEGWTLKNDLSGWLIGDTSYSSEYCDYSGNSSKFVLANPDSAGNETVVRDYAVTPLFNISYYDEVKLDFDYILNNESDQYYYCDISVMYRNGLDQDWILLEQLNDTGDWINHSIQVPYEAISSNYTQFSFFIDDYYKWSMGGGGIDNVSITGSMTTNAPVITEYYPEETSITLICAQNVMFSVIVEDSDTGISELDFKWYVNDILIQSGVSEFSYGFDISGNYEIKVVVNDKYNEDFTVWNVLQTDTNENIPLTTKLYQNYPNPFNPATTISFDLSLNTAVQLNVYDLKGSLVRTLLNEKMKMGRYSIIWDGKDNIGNSLSSGVYYINLMTGKENFTHKSLMIK